MGSVVMTEPAIRALKEANPQAKISLLTSPSGAQAARLLSCIDETIVYEAPWQSSTPKTHTSDIDQALIENLKVRNFDAAAIFTSYDQSSLPAVMLSYMSDIPLRLAHARENPSQLLTHWAEEVEPEKTIRHEVRRQLEMVALAGCHVSDERIRLKLSEEAHHKLTRKLSKRNFESTRPFFVVQPGAPADSRRYPAEKFSEVIRELWRQTGWRILLTGTHSERALISEVISEASVPCENLAGELDLEEFAALLSRASALISNNTGPVHLAAGLRTPVIDIYALTNPQHTPWKVPSRVLYFDTSCRYCYKSLCPEKHNNCIQLIEPSDVVTATLELLGEIGVGDFVSVKKAKAVLEESIVSPETSPGFSSDFSSDFWPAQLPHPSRMGAGKGAFVNPRPIGGEWR